VIWKENNKWCFDTPMWLDKDNFEENGIFKLFNCETKEEFTIIGYENCPEYDLKTIKSVVKSGYEQSIKDKWLKKYDLEELKKIKDSLENSEEYPENKYNHVDLQKDKIIFASQKGKWIYAKDVYKQTKLLKILCS
jgi:hypothetical protein